MNDVLGWILETVRGVDPALRVLLAGVGMFFETSILLGLIVPGDTIVIVASTGIANWGQYVALLCAVIVGSLGGESVGFALGRWFGPRIRRSTLGRKLGEHNWIRAENYLERRGGIAVFISRFLPVMHSLIPLTVGTSAMPYRTFLRWSVPACVIWAGAYVSVGWLAAGSYDNLSNQLHYAGYFFVAIIAVFLLIALLAKKVIEKREKRHMHPVSRAGGAEEGRAETEEAPKP